MLSSFIIITPEHVHIHHWNFQHDFVIGLFKMTIITNELTILSSSNFVYKVNSVVFLFGVAPFPSKQEDDYIRDQRIGDPSLPTPQTSLQEFTDHCSLTC